MDAVTAFHRLSHLHMNYLFTLDALPQNDFEHRDAYNQFISHSSSGATYSPGT